MTNKLYDKHVSYFLMLQIIRFAYIKYDNLFRHHVRNITHDL